MSGAKFSTVLALYRVLGPDVFIAAGMAEEEKSMKGGKVYERRIDEV